MLEKKLEQLEKEIINLLERIKMLYAQNMKLAEELRLFKERERYLLSEIERLKKSKFEDKIKNKLEDISRMIEREIHR